MNFEQVHRRRLSSPGHRRTEPALKRARDYCLIRRLDVKGAEAVDYPAEWTSHGQRETKCYHRCVPSELPS